MHIYCVSRMLVGSILGFSVVLSNYYLFFPQRSPILRDGQVPFYNITPGLQLPGQYLGISILVPILLISFIYLLSQLLIEGYIIGPSTK